MVKEKFSAGSYFFLLFLSSMCSVFMYLSSSQIKIAQTETVLRPLIFILVSFLAPIPVFFVVKEHKRCVDSRVFIPKTKAFKVISAVYAVCFFISALKTIARFDLFVSSELFPDKNIILFLLGIIVVCSVVSLCGVGSLARASVILFVLVIVSTAFVMVSLKSELSFLNFTPLFSNGMFSFLKDSLLFSFQITELGTLIMFLPFVQGNKKRSFALWSVLSGVCFSVVFFFVVGALGSFADTQLFPTYTAVTLASFGLLERVDALETSIWIICVVQKLSFYIFVVTKCLRYAFCKVSEKLVVFSVASVLCIVTCSLSLNIERFEYLSSNILTVILFVLLIIVLPAFVCLQLKAVSREKIEEDI